MVVGLRSIRQIWTLNDFKVIHIYSTKSLSHNFWVLQGDYLAFSENLDYRAEHIFYISPTVGAFVPEQIALLI